MVPKHLETDPGSQPDTTTPQVGIPTISPDRPNLDLRKAEARLDEPSKTIAPIPTQRSRTVLIIAAVCAVGVLGAAGIVLYSAFSGDDDGKGEAASEAVTTPAQVHTLSATAAPTVTPIVEPIAVEPVVAALATSEEDEAARRRSARRAERRQRREAEKAASTRKRAEAAAEKSTEPVGEKSTEPVGEKSTKPVGEKSTKPVGEKSTSDAVGEKPTKAAAEKPVADANGTGILMLGAKPPCAIHIDGRDTGMKTPQRKIELESGTHRVILVNEAYSIREEFSVKIVSGEKKRVIKDMTDRITP